MPDNEILVSIVMCTFNGEKHLPLQLSSILNQTYKNIEVIISDDASVDNTWNILNNYAQSYPHLKLYRNNKTLGFVENFNQATLKAKGDVIAFSDQDDIWHSEKIAFMLKNWPIPNALIYCNSERFYGSPPDWPNPLQSTHRRFSGTDPRKLAVFNTVSGHALMIKRSLLPYVFPVQQGVVYDWVAGVAAACNGGVAYLPETLVLQRIHKKNTTVNSGYEYSKTGNNYSFKQLVGRQLRVFSQIENMPDWQNKFMKELNILWQKSLQKEFSGSLFLFLLKNRHILFWRKRKFLDLPSLIKHCYRLSKNSAIAGSANVRADGDDLPHQK